MKSASLLFGLTLSGLLLVTSCKKDNQEDGNHHEATPTITIITPTENEEVNLSTVNITGTIESTEELHGYSIVIRKKTIKL